MHAHTASADPAKRKKALEKKLKQIDDLKVCLHAQHVTHLASWFGVLNLRFSTLLQKRAAGGEALNADQQEKLSSEEEIRQQLAALAL